MNRLIAIVLIALLLVPTLAHWMPDYARQMLHEQQEAHHQGGVDHHERIAHHGHDSYDSYGHDEDHPVYFDIVSFLDLFHIDLKQIAKVKIGGFDVLKLVFTVALASFVILPLLRRRHRPLPPPDRQWGYFGKPVYLATQRLRI